MKIRTYVTTELANRQKQVSEERELLIGRYNEFYLPALMDTRKKEMWIEIAADDGSLTFLHLKR